MKDLLDNYGSSAHEPAEDQPGETVSQPDFLADYPVADDALQLPSAIDAPRLVATDQALPVSKAASPEGEMSGEIEDVAALGVLLEELDQMIGLERVKSEVRSLIQYVRVQEMRRARGISESRMALHSVFYGSPGTGKTTVARLYGRMLKTLGLLSSGHLIETDRSGLVANYIGQTATKTDRKVEEALGGVLFIDEAYALSRGEHAQWDFGSEAIEVLVKRMEDHRDDLVVIAAGYHEPMSQFLGSNEGLRSRFSTYIHFDDFSPHEMLEIFRLFCRRENYELDEDAADMALAAIEYQYAKRDRSFGNARSVRNLFEMVIRNHALRVGLTKAEPTMNDLRLITAEDVPLITDRDM